MTEWEFQAYSMTVLVILVFVFAWRWVSHHLYDRFNDVPLSARLDVDFWALAITGTLILVLGFQFLQQDL